VSRKQVETIARNGGNLLFRNGLYVAQCFILAHLAEQTGFNERIGNYSGMPLKKYLITTILLQVV
jgi:hypothetical protein